MGSQAAIDPLVTQAQSAASRNDLATAERICQQILSAAPDRAEIHHLLGTIAARTGEPARAIASLRRAAELDSGNAEILLHLSMVYLATDEPASALAAAEAAVRVQPTFRTHFNVGNIHLMSGRPAEAIEAFEHASPFAPNEPRLLNNLANALSRLGRHDEALQLYRTALTQAPKNPSLLLNLSNEQLALGQIDSAIDSIRRSIRCAPLHAEGHRKLSTALQLAGQSNEALAAAQRAAQLAPAVAEFQQHVGVLLARMNRKQDSLAAFERATQIEPKSADAWNNLGVMCKDIGDYDRAADAYGQAVRLRPDFAVAVANLAGILRETGDMVGAVAGCRKALELNPDSSKLLSNLILFLHFCPGDHAEELKDLYRRFNRQFVEPAMAKRPRLMNVPQKDRKLRIGYVSPDFHCTAGGRFLLPLLQAHDQSRFETYCYYDHTTFDAMTDQHRAAATAWRDVAGEPYDALAQKIRDDQIDILVDLAMHTPRNRMCVFAAKPAPVQVTYLAYVGTTGLATMDYRFTDAHLDPLEFQDRDYAERSVRLKSYWCYPPPAEAPAMATLPADRNRHVTFGSFNSFAKVSDEVLEVWARILAAVPASRLLLHTPQGKHRARIAARFVAAGVEADRIAFFAMLELSRFFELFQTVDIALDSFPYAGGTTTCDALWMGVPVITLACREAHGRGGVSILSQLGLTECIASGTQDYVQMAQRLAGNHERLRDLRQTLRARMLGSPLMDAPAFARDVEAAYRTMWNEWCEQRASASAEGLTK